MSSAGFSGSDSNVLYVFVTGYISNYYVYRDYHLRPVLNLTSNTQASSGDGTKENPFVIE